MIALPLVLKLASGAFTILSLGTGVRAAILCVRAGKVEPDPDWGYPGDVRLRPVIPELEQMGWTNAILQAGSEAGRLNRRAAAWTIASVILSALAGLAADLV